MILSSKKVWLGIDVIVSHLKSIILNIFIYGEDENNSLKHLSICVIYTVPKMSPGNLARFAHSPFVIV